MRIERRSFQAEDKGLPETMSLSLRRIFLARGVCSSQELDYRLPLLLRPDSLFDLSNAACILADAIEAGDRKSVV